jgi:hypothetical protein
MRRRAIRPQQKAAPLVPTCRRPVQKLLALDDLLHLLERPIHCSQVLPRELETRQLRLSPEEQIAMLPGLRDLDPHFTWV